MEVVPLSVGIMLPSRETAMTGRHDAPGLVAFAKTAEESGFDSVWIGDSLLARPRAEPLSVLSAVAAVTERVTLGTAALIAPLRHPLLAAAQAATVDQLSRGRLILGLGSGAPLPESRREFDAVGTPFGGRGGRLDEMVARWRQVWSCDGDFGDALPPARRGGPPLWLAGGDTTRVIDRVSSTYDGWLPYLPDPDAYARAWEWIRAQAVGDVTPALYATVNLSGARADDELDGYLRAYYRQPLEVMRHIQAIRGGSVEECADWLARYIDAGARHLILRIGSLAPRPEMLVDLMTKLRALGAEQPPRVRGLTRP
jgi:alkanesulfonate monooxygenase SsuD/methylene tetrahydromethanopterin reductase-like flavin-dependent oxidoreductase (luciferase family)